MVRSRGWLLLVVSVGCGSVAGEEKKDAPVAIDTHVADTSTSDAGPIGTAANPADSCGALKTAGKPTGVYFLKDPGGGTAFEGYCDQDRNSGGWALVYRSVMSTGTTTQFWQINYAQRLDLKGAPIAGANFYAPTLYRSGLEYMDVITDLQDKTVIAMVATATGFDPATMKFTSPALSVGNSDIYDNQFATGWSSSDYDGDVNAPDNCATLYSNVAQHYGNCFRYNLGADADAPVLDGGVGPHVSNQTLAALVLSTEPNGGTFSRVKVIERYARW